MSNPTGGDFAGGANMSLQGTLYFPNSLLTIDNGVQANIMAFVVGKLSLQGGTTINAATSTSQTGSAADRPHMSH